MVDSSQAKQFKKNGQTITVIEYQDQDGNIRYIVLEKFRSLEAYKKVKTPKGTFDVYRNFDRHRLLVFGHPGEAFRDADHVAEVFANNNDPDQRSKQEKAAVLSMLLHLIPVGAAADQFSEGGIKNPEAWISLGGDLKLRQNLLRIVNRQAS